jgi:starch-binding outer membrane protein, SusD/RagB family
MKKNHYIYMLLVFLLGGLTTNSCTNLEETTYDKIISNTFYQTKDDVYRSFLRSFEHGYWTIQGTQFVLQENTADQLMTPNRQGDWYDGGQYIRLHNHTWTTTDGFCNDAWKNLFIGISLANNSLEDIRALDVSKFNMSLAEQKSLVAELRTLRAWYYLRLFDLYRNIPIVETTKGATQAPLQATPQATFDFIEKELKEAVVDMAKKGDAGIVTSRWTQAGAMALLTRLYLNAKVYTGTDRFDDCAKVSQEIIDGKYGSYGIANRWDAPYDWNNDLCEETIFAFPGSFGRTHWQYDSGMYWWALPYNVNKYLEFTDFGTANPKYTLQPGHDVAGNIYNYTSNLGQPFVKFQNYPDDVRLKLYKNLGNSTREGMFLFGYLTYNEGKNRITSTKGYDLYIRDQVGWFDNLAPDKVPTDLASNMNHADQNSGVYFVKYPFYKTVDTHKIESDYAEVRLAEVYYALAECKFRKGDKTGAEKVLNTVRKRYFPAGSASLYPENGSKLTESELLDEWGREFLGEGRRRTDLIRFGKFNTATWWDKTADTDNHTEIFPIGLEVLGVSPQLKQNPGYDL